MDRNPAVDTYLVAADEARRAGLEALRRACLDELVGFTEVMRYAMPGYERDGDVEIVFADQKRYLSLYVLRTAVLDAHRDRLAGLSLGKGCIRYRRVDQIDLEVVRSMLRQTVADTGEIC